jgi:hypothetical protein
VNCDKLSRHIPGFKTDWTVRKGAEEMYDAAVRNGLTAEAFAGYVRLNRIQSQMRDGRLDPSLRWRASAVAV